MKYDELLEKLEFYNNITIGLALLAALIVLNITENVLLFLVTFYVFYYALRLGAHKILNPLRKEVLDELNKKGECTK